VKVHFSTVSSGMIIEFAGSIAPSGWLLCNGSSLLVANYQPLWNVIGYTYGGAGASFNLPNLMTSGSTVVGRDNMGGAPRNGFTNTNLSGVPGQTIGTLGGEFTHSTTVSEMGSHGHTGTASGSNSSLAHTHEIEVNVNDTETGSGGAAQYIGWPQITYPYTNTGNATSDSPTLNHGHTVTILAVGSVPTYHNNTQPSIVTNFIIKI
jgi:microcystin-dependent protein